MLHARNIRLKLATGTMDCIRFGSGPRTLVMIPGVGDGLKTVKGMARDFTVYGFSRRVELPEHMTPREMAGDLAMAMDALGLARAAVLGVSQGGMASIFGISPHAIAVPDIDSYVGLMHTLFTLEDRYGFHVEEADGDVCLRVNFRENPQAAEIHRMLYEWQAAANALRKGEITREAYDQWRYNFLVGDTTRRWVKVPSQRLMDDLVAGPQEHADDDHE